MSIFGLHVMFVGGHARFIVGDANSFSALKRITITSINKYRKWLMVWSWTMDVSGCTVTTQSDIFLDYKLTLRPTIYV